MNVKGDYEDRRGRRKPDGEAGDINMSDTSFTNIKTCNSTSSHVQHETQPATDTAAPTRFYYANAAYGVILCHSTYCQLIDDGYVVS